ncbi:phosphonate ABC transporter, permease protein PhnE [Rhodospira trueperi]|uniref:Phosphonate transport system permease protein n=1 Tax=Rhodospira trueperi TaxID=69960 RepID=A0A1G6ZAE0_9PROT|nr:phosphonate ABC transporter, permease protein PhnE [Rhodospira trueperi]SDD98825.1 phosphonate transport system permease protein [Rhodospira trueperi]
MIGREAVIPSADEVAALRRRHPRLFLPPLRQRLGRWAGWAGFAAFLVYALWQLRFFDVAMIAAGFGRLGDVLSFMWPPAHNGNLPDFLKGIGETLAMAFLGTLGAALLAVPLGFLGAKTVVRAWPIHFLTRRTFDVFRGISQLIWAMIFINVVGLGPFAGILAIIVGDMAVLAKMFAEAIENIDQGEVEGVRAAGGGRLAEIRLGMLPQVVPIMLSQTLYYFESNTRSSTILGFVGAGGIGLQLSDRIRVNNWDEAGFIIILILITVFLIDTLSRFIRQRFIGVRGG